MESESAIALAANVLKDHFGPIVQKVGQVLLEKGALSLQEVLHYTRLVFDNPVDEPLSFQQVRNAMLVLLQHGLISAKPHPKLLASGAKDTGILQLYSVDVDEVLARLRFSQFLEYVMAKYGELAYELLFAALRYGRVSRSKAIEEACKAVTDSSAAEAEQLLMQLVKDRVLRPVDPCASPASVTADTPAVAIADKATSSQPSLKRKLEQNGNGQEPKDGHEPGALLDNASEDSEDEVVAQVASKALALVPAGAGAIVPAGAGAIVPAGAGAIVPAGKVAGDKGQLAIAQVGSASSSRPASYHVYRYDRANLNLCLCKCLYGRIVEERVSPHASLVLAALLTGVVPSQNETEKTVSASYMQFRQVETRIQEMGGLPAGRDAERERGKIRRALDLLSAHNDSVVRKRLLKGHSASASSRQQPAAGDGQQNDNSEWSVEWPKLRQKLVEFTRSQLVRDQFGTLGLRMFNLLSDKDPPQRLEENQIFNSCMVPVAEGREILNNMVRRSLVQWQQVPRSSDNAICSSYWLYYVDKQRVESALEEGALRALLNLRVRFCHESAKVVPLESRVNSLTAKERIALREGRRTEDILERSFLVLDAVPMVFRCPK
ncbi:unnamed protein product [Polarella glacialis]|uniref:DNA-directed RNA polymerase III subunit RPC3 n=1 Tax=Polarella glacialis TaxID=89957 RepID=A0A813LAD7_POLGL|nr:unnamed protein product [Polarella glacialis]